MEEQKKFEICSDKIDSISSFLAYVGKKKKGHKADFLFRGQDRDLDNPLRPGLARLTIKGRDKLLNIERIIHEEFARTAPFTTVSLADKWDRLALSQHHGLPTRLLDWTYSATAALWFVVKRTPQKDRHGRKQDGVVWIIKSEKKDFVQGDDFKTDPFATRRTRIFRPRMITERISAQSGVFTLHAARQNEDDPFLPLERNKRFAPKLIKVPIKWKFFEPLREQLGISGVNYATMFPDLDGLCRHLKWRYTEKGRGSPAMA